MGFADMMDRSQVGADPDMMDPRRRRFAPSTDGDEDALTFQGGSSGGTSAGSQHDLSGSSSSGDAYPDEFVRGVQQRVAAGQPQFKRPQRMGGGKAALLIGLGAAAGPRGAASISDEAFNRPYQRAQQEFKDSQGQYAEDVSTLRNISSDKRQQQHYNVMDDYYSGRNQPRSLEQVRAKRAADVIAGGGDPSQDQQIQALDKEIKATQKAPAEKNHNLYDDYASGDPDRQKTARGYLHDSAQSKQDVKPDPSEKKGTRGQFKATDDRKDAAFGNLEKDYKNGLVGDDELLDRKQQIQDAYERDNATLGGEPTHLDVRSAPEFNKKPQAPQVNPPGQAAPAAKAPPKKGETKMYQGKPYVFDGTKYVAQSPGQ